MKFTEPENRNYCGTVVTLENFTPLENCDNLKAAFVFGDQVIVSKDTEAGTKGIYFPPETQLSSKFLSNNNLYRKKELNVDKEKAGYFETNGRVRTVKLRGNKSIGVWLPINCIEFTGAEPREFADGLEFDSINGIHICNKYVIEKTEKLPGTKKQRKKIKESKVIDGQFKFHGDTEKLQKNLYAFSKNNRITISYKLHGTSFIASRVLCKKKLNPVYKFLKAIGIPIVDAEYDNIYSSRKVIKNDDLNKSQHYYDVDIWGLANKKLDPFIEKGMSIYGEIVGFLPNGKYIQKPYDYGVDANKFDIYIYRITYTNLDGKVFEFSSKQLQEWCKNRGLNSVPELYHGSIKDFCKQHGVKGDWDDHLLQGFLEKLKELYLEKDCYLCKNKLPAEGVVVRKEGLDFESYKLKSFRFLEHETKLLDKGEVDIET